MSGRSAVVVVHTKNEVPRSSAGGSSVLALAFISVFRAIEQVKDFSF
jgi:hypothetical protein